MIQDAVAFDLQQQMRMIQEARADLEAHGMSQEDVEAGIGADPGSPAVQTPGESIQVPEQPTINDVVASNESIFIEAYTGGDVEPDPMRPVDSWEYRIDGGSWIPYSGGDPAWSIGDITLTGLTNGVEYTIDIRAVNTVGPGPYSTTTGTPYTTPSAPTLNSVINGPACDQIIVNYSLGPDGGAPVSQAFVIVRINGDSIGAFGMVPVGTSPITLTIPGIGGNSINVVALVDNAAGDSPESNSIGLDANYNNCNIRVTGSTYSFLNGTFNRRSNGYVVRPDDVAPFNGFYYSGNTYAYSPSAADDQSNGAYIIMGPGTSLRSISNPPDGVWFTNNTGGWIYMNYSFDSDGGFWYTGTPDPFTNASTGSTVPLGTWIAGGGWGSNITVN
jgi:hypothetical protein